MCNHGSNHHQQAQAIGNLWIKKYICGVLNESQKISKDQFILPPDMQPDMISGMGIARKLLLGNDNV